MTTSNLLHLHNENDSTSSYKGSSLHEELTPDLDDIYNSYMMKSASIETLDSRRNQQPSPFLQQQQQQELRQQIFNQNLPEIHISSRLSSLGLSNGDKVTRSAPTTPKSGNSFDFRPRRTYNTHAATNSSLNVVLDLPSEGSNFQASTDTLLSSSIDDGIPLSRELQQEQDEWTKKGEAVKAIKEGEDVKIIRRTVNDFKFGKALGEGSYSTVVLATDKNTSKQYAVKILDKRHIIKEKKVKYVNIEKHALNRLRNRTGIISLYFTFQDKDSLYFVLDYASNGELLTLIKNNGTLNQDCARHFGAQILDAIKYMHDNGVIHRDIKPENILLDHKMRIQITDFGTARLLEKKDDTSEEYPVDVRAKSFVGTAEYVSPELLESKYCGKPGDIWAFGCILYQMIAGKPPFKAPNEYLTFQKITKLQYAFSAGFPSVLRDLIKKILVLQPAKRVTIPEIQKHYFFQTIEFDDFDLIWEKEPPEIGPYKMSAESMMKVPELNKTPTSTVVMIPRRKQQPSKKTNNANNNASTPERPPMFSKASTGPVDAVSVAAFVLNKSQAPDQTQDTESSNTSPDSATPDQTRTSSSKRQPDYIPGTNILRPQVNTRRTFSRQPNATPTNSTPSSNRQKRSSTSRPKSKVMEITPATAVEAAWASYLNHPDERVLRIGPVIVHKEPTDAFEKKHKGMLHASPLDLSNNLKLRSGTSLLSQMVNGQQQHNNLSSNGYRNESIAIFDYYDVAENGLKRNGSKKDNKSSSGSSRDDTASLGSGGKITRSSLFRKFGFSHGGDKKDEGSSDSKSHDLLEKPRTCTLIVTTHGRALLFYRPEKEANYKLILEIKLKYPFIHFQELVTSKYQKSLPTTGIFVISSMQTCFVCEVESSEINRWTESLTKSKVNELERVKETQPQQQDPTPPASSSPGKKTPSPSPKPVQSPKFTASPQQQQQPATPNVPSASHRRSPELISMHKRASHEVKRKPPPPVTSSPELNIHTGLPSTSEDSGWLHAAQLAVSNNTAQGVPPTNNRRTSYKREDTTNRGHVQKANPSASGNSAGITSLNSKFLARSQRNR